MEKPEEINNIRPPEERQPPVAPRPEQAKFADVRKQPTEPFRLPPEFRSQNSQPDLPSPSFRQQQPTVSYRPPQPTAYQESPSAAFRPEVSNEPYQPSRPPAGQNGRVNYAEPAHTGPVVTQNSSAQRRPVAQPKKGLPAWLLPVLGMLALPLIALGLFSLLAAGNAGRIPAAQMATVSPNPIATVTSGNTPDSTAPVVTASNPSVNSPVLPPVPAFTATVVPTVSTAEATATTTGAATERATNPPVPNRTAMPTVAATAPVVSTSASSDQNTWKQFTSSEGGFSVSLPGTPTKQEEFQQSAAGPVERETYFVNLADKGELYLVGFVNYSKEFIARQKPEELLKEARDLAVRSSNAKLVAEKTIKLGQYPGREWEMQLPNGVVIKARYYVANNRLYQTVVSAVNTLPADSQKFLDSFKLTDAVLS